MGLYFPEQVPFHKIDHILEVAQADTLPKGSGQHCLGIGHQKTRVPERRRHAHAVADLHDHVHGRGKALVDVNDLLGIDDVRLGAAAEHEHFRPFGINRFRLPPDHEYPDQ